MNSSEQTHRGQAHTLEAVVGAIFLLTALTFALQMTIVTPLSASTSSQHIEEQQRAVAEGILASAAEDGTLKEAVLYWNETANNFHNASERGYYAGGPPDNTFGERLARAFDTDGIAYNVYIGYLSNRGVLNEREMIVQGTPSDNAVSVTQTLGVRNDDRLVDADGSLNDTTVRDADLYLNNGPAEAAGRNSHGLYNVVRVEVVVWRI
jgi:hypothetical protein